MSLVAKVGATTLDDAFGKKFEDQLKGAGSFSLSFQNDDPDIPSHGDVVTFEVDGTARFAGVVGADTIVTHAQGEEANQTTTVSGLGRLGTTRRGLVRPSRGVGELPTERSRSQFWGAWDFDVSAALGKNIRRADDPTSYAPNRTIPEWWLAREAWWVWSDQVDVDETDAPLGRCLIWHDFTVASDGEIEIHVAFNNKGFLFFDGARVADVANAPKDGNRIRLDVTAGTHRLAASVTNFIRDGGYIDAIWTVDDDGLLDTLISSSDESNTYVLGYPDDLPTITPGEAIRRILEQMQANDELLGLTLDFDDDLDSDGQAWVGVVEISSQVGAKLYDYLLALADWAIDVHMTPAGVLQAWNYGTRGADNGVQVVATTDRNTSEVEALSHDGRDIRANRLMVETRRDLIEVDDAASILANGVIPDFVKIDVETTEAATAAAEALLDLRKDSSYAVTLTLSPVSAVPYEDFDVGDYIEHPDEAGGTKISRVLSIAVTEDDEGNLTWVLELNDIRREVEERHDNTLKRYAMGDLSGGANVVGPSGENLPSLSRISEKQVAEFSFDGALTASTSPARPASSSGNLIEIFVELTTAGTSDTDIDVLKNGTSILGGSLITLGSGDTSASFNLDGAKTYRNVDKYRVQIVTAGTGAEGLDVQVRAI